MCAMYSGRTRSSRPALLRSSDLEAERGSENLLLSSRSLPRPQTQTERHFKSTLPPPHLFSPFMPGPRGDHSLLSRFLPPFSLTDTHTKTHHPSPSYKHTALSVVTSLKPGPIIRAPLGSPSPSTDNHLHCRSFRPSVSCTVGMQLPSIDKSGCSGGRVCKAPRVAAKNQNVSIALTPKQSERRLRLCHS